MKPVLVAGAVIALAATGTGVWWRVAHARDVPQTASHAPIDRDTMRLVGDTVRIKVEVLNASGERGLARRAMFYLRDRGFDVVSMGNATERTDSSVVIDRSGHAAWARVAARAVGCARIEVHADSSRYVDLTILLGARFRSPSQILYP